MNNFCPQLFMECVNCLGRHDMFLFNGDTCIFCSDGKQIIKSKINYYRGISDQGGRIIGEYEYAIRGILCRCSRGHFCRPKPTDIQQGKDMCKICSKTKSAPTGTPKERFHAMIIQLGGEVTGQYINCGTRVSCICSHGHSCEVMPRYVQQGRKICDTCVKDNPDKPGRQFIDKIKELGGKVIGKYVNAETRVHCICKHKHDCNPLPSHIEQGRKMCPTCHTKSQIKAEEKFRDRVKELGGQVMGKYIHHKKRIKCLCPKQHYCFPTPKGIKAGTKMCRICEGNAPGTAEKKFRDRIKELGGQVIGKYVRSMDQILCLCSNGHECNVLPANVRRGGMCRTCAGQNPTIVRQNFYDSIKELGGRVLGEYVNAHTPVSCICSQGHKCSPHPSHIRAGSGMCSSCGLKSEPMCRIIFEELLEISLPKKRPVWLTWKKNPLELDGYNEEAGIAFEYQGIQHEKYVPHFHRNGLDDFQIQLEKDEFKVKQCRERGVLLFVIPSTISYTDPEAMEIFILEQLIEHNLI